MQKEIFADGISAIHLTGNLLRIDFATVQPQLKAPQDNQPAIETNVRLILPIDGFLKGFELQQNIVKQLVDAGVISLNPPANTDIKEN